MHNNNNTGIFFKFFILINLTNIIMKLLKILQIELIIDNFHRNNNSKKVSNIYIKKKNKETLILKKILFKEK